MTDLVTLQTVLWYQR